MKKIIGAAVIILLLVLVLDGHSSLEDKGKMTMPEAMPEDFNFSIRFGVTGKNEVNSFKDEVTKDLVSNGVAKATLELTDDEMKLIYERMRDIPVTDRLDMKLSKLTYTCTKVPYIEEHWIITINRKTYTYDYSDENCALTKDAKKLKELRIVIFDIVKEKEAYISLPESVGGYD